MPKRTHKVLPLSEKVKVLNLIWKEKNPYAEVPKIYLGIFILKNGWMNITVGMNTTVIVKK